MAAGKNNVQAAIDKLISDKQEAIATLFLQVYETLINASDQVEITVKWGMPHIECKGIVAGVSAFKHHVSVWFHKGVLMEDPHQLFESNATNKTMRQVKLTNWSSSLSDQLTAYIQAAIALNEKGVKLPSTTVSSSTSTTFIIDPIFAAHLEENEVAQHFFERLAPSHKRAYNDWIVEAKRKETQLRRIEKALRRLEDQQKTIY